MSWVIKPKSYKVPSQVNSMMLSVAMVTGMNVLFLETCQHKWEALVQVAVLLEQVNIAWHVGCGRPSEVVSCPLTSEDKDEFVPILKAKIYSLVAGF